MLIFKFLDSNLNPSNKLHYHCIKNTILYVEIFNQNLHYW